MAGNLAVPSRCREANIEDNSAISAKYTVAAINHCRSWMIGSGSG